MKEYIEERAIEIGKYIVDYRATVRQAAKQFHISKSTVHMDSIRLEKINPVLYEEVRSVMDLNKSERHIRGGMATKQKYLHQASGSDRHRNKNTSPREHEEKHKN